MISEPFFPGFRILKPRLRAINRSVALVALLSAIFSMCAVVPLAGAESEGPEILDANHQMRCDLALAAQHMVEEVRGEQFSEDVVCEVKSRTQIGEYVRRRIESELPPDQLKFEGIVCKALGMFPANLDYEAAVLRVYETSLGGFYDPDTRAFTIADWTSFESLKGIAIHELTHALQDQRFNLETFVDFKALSNDEVLARMALVEGEATLIAKDAEERAVGKPPLTARRLAVLKELAGDFSAPFSVDTPEALQQLVQFPYHAGAPFVLSILEGSTYASVNSVFSRPPMSTEEVLHPLKYQQNKSDYENPAASVSNDRDDPVVFTDVVGEFAIRVLLRELGAAGSDAVAAAAGWGGDRVELRVQKNGSFDVLWRTRWDSVGDAAEFLKYFEIGQRTKRAANQQQSLVGRTTLLRDAMVMSIFGGTRSGSLVPVDINIHVPVAALKRAAS